MPFYDMEKLRQAEIDRFNRIEEYRKNPPSHAHGKKSDGEFSWLGNVSEEEVAMAEMIDYRLEINDIERARQKDMAQQVPSLAEMSTGLLKTAGIALRNGKVDASTREARMETCKACPSFNAKTSQCKECGCLMVAKTWINGGPGLCPLAKWAN